MGSNPIPSAKRGMRTMPQTQLSPSSYHIWTIGCQMNTADSERLAGALEGMGLEETSRPQDADVIVLNSCVVRQGAEDKVVGMVTSLKPVKRSRPDRILALMGCMVGPSSARLQQRFPYVDVFMRPQQYEPLIDLIGGRLGVDVDGCLRDLGAGPASRRNARAGHPRLRRVLLVLHHPVPPGPPEEPPRR